MLTNTGLKTQIIHTLQVKRKEKKKEGLSPKDWPQREGQKESNLLAWAGLTAMTSNAKQQAAVRVGQPHGVLRTSMGAPAPVKCSAV